MNFSELKAEYDEISPVTGEKCVIKEVDDVTGITSYICMQSGYVTSEQLTIGSDVLQEFEGMITALMKDLKLEDNESGLVWYPAFIQLPIGMLYCDGESVADWSWKIAEIVPLDEVERLSYPLPGLEGQYYTSKLDTDNAKAYDKLDFETAFSDLYTILNRQIDEVKAQTEKLKEAVNEDKLRNSGS